MAASAHSKNRLGKRHDLVEHLRGVAAQAEEFGRAFGGGDLARAAGLYHDLGKFHPEFQAYLDWCDAHPGQRRRGGDHKGAGVQYTAAMSGALPLVIVAHHGGLQSPSDLRSWLAEDRVRTRIGEALRLAAKELPEIARTPAPVVPPAFAELDAVAG